MVDRIVPALSEPLLYEMVRTFLVLADTLNVSRAATQLKVTRQTVKRHLSNLERHRGTKLFDVIGQSYSLTEEGRNAVPSAYQLLIEAENWCKALPFATPTMQRYGHYASEVDYTYLEQKGINDVFVSDTPFMKDCLLMWIRSKGQLEELAALRQFAMTFRRDSVGWLIVEVGDAASSVEWFGAKWQKSCIGQRVDNLPASNRLAPISNSAFETITNSQSVRLDHICTQFPNADHPAGLPISYKRLMLSATFPSEETALISIVERSHDLRIQGLPDNLRTSMSEEYVMNVTL